MERNHNKTNKTVPPRHIPERHRYLIYKSYLLNCRFCVQSPNGDGYLPSAAHSLAPCSFNLAVKALAFSIVTVSSSGLA